MHDTPDHPPKQANHPITRREATARIIGAAASTGAITSLFAQATGAPQGAGAREAVDFSPLAQQIEGTVTPASDAAFEAARQSAVWNGLKPKRAPDAIVRVKSVSDVQHAVRFARQNGLKVAIRGGGHSWCASPVREGGILLDLGELNTLEIDADARRAVAGPAVKGGEFIHALAPHKLAFPVGHCPSVPLSGYILSGGIGWNSGAWGPACANLVGLDVVTAEGELLHADSEQNQDYLWAARGAGPGFFGVAVKFHLQLHELPAVIRTQLTCFSMKNGSDVGAWLMQLTTALRPEIELTCVIGTAPADAPRTVVDAMGRSLIVMATAFATTPAEADAWLKPFASPPRQLQHHVAPVMDTPMEALLSMNERTYPPDRRYTAEMIWCHTGPADVLDPMARVVASAPSRESFAFVAVPAPSAKDAPLPDMAYSRLGQSLVGIYSIWTDANADDAHVSWLRRAGYMLKNTTAGHYVGESDLTSAANRARECFGTPQWSKLESLRRAHDPDGVFHTFLSTSDR